MTAFPPGDRPAFPLADAERPVVPSLCDPRADVPFILKALDVASFFAASPSLTLQLPFLQQVRSLLTPPHANELDCHSTVVFSAPALHGDSLLTASAEFLECLFADVFFPRCVPDGVGVLRVFNQNAIFLLTNLPAQGPA